MYGLALCAIFNSSQLEASLLQSASSSTNGDSSCFKAFHLLRALLVKLFDDFQHRQDQVADSLLVSSYRYLCGYGDSLLYDPKLYRLVNQLMRKLFKRLVAEMSKLGVKLVYGDFNRLIIATGKQDVAAAKEYIEFILMAVSNVEMFRYLEVSDSWMCV